jgi:hypothetical protein
VSAPKPASGSAARRDAKSRAALVAAYREGLGLAGIAVLRGDAGAQIAVIGEGSDDAAAAAGDAVAAKWWCRRADDAKRVATAATARLRRRGSQDDAAKPSAANGAPSPGDICGAVEQTAKRLHVALYSDGDIAADADRIIARMNEEVEALQRAGQLKSVNQSYRSYRMAASARGEKAAPYTDWFDKYKANLVRELAAVLRTI